MSKLSFRARALDATKPMPIYYKHELSDLQDYSVLNRAVPQMPSGMEKEEETEHHLQRAISAQQVYGDTKVMVIPVPEAEISLECYNNLYKKTFRLPKHYVHNQAQALNSIMEQEQPDYDMDSEDERWMKDSKKRAGLEVTHLQFEEMIDRLEKSCGNQLVTLQEAKLLLKEDDDLIKAVYDYWLKKRKRQKGPLVFQVRHDRRDGSSINDCYVAFRRRTEKMQTRKNRKNDEASYEKMLKLRRDLSRAVTILEMIKRREKSKRELLHLTLEVFEKRYQMRDWEGKALRMVKKDLLTQKSWAHFRSLKGGHRRRHPSLSSSLITGHKPSTSTSLSISRGEIDRGEHGPISSKKKLKKKHARPGTSLHGAAPATAPSHPAQPNVEVIDRLKIPVKHSPVATRSPTGATTKWSSTPAASDTMSYEEVVDTMTQYEFPPSSDEDIKEQIGATSPTESFDAKKYPDGNFTFRRRPGCVYYAPQESAVGDWPWTSDPRHRYSLTTLSIPEKCIGFARRRMGRGGRILLDRGHHPYSREIEKLDLCVEHDHQPVKPRLQDLLQEIKRNRWRHFRPSQNAQSSSAPTDDETVCDADSSFSWNSPCYPADFLRDPADTKGSGSNQRENTSEQGQKTAKSSTAKPHKKTSSSSSNTMERDRVAFAMSALVSVGATTPVTTATTAPSQAGASRLVSGSRSSVTKSFKHIGAQQTKCVTCGGIVSFTTSVTSALADSVEAGTNRPLTLPVNLSVATSAMTASSAHHQRTTVLPATVTLSTSKAHSAGVPALLKISGAGSVVGGTVIYPQQSAKADDGKMAPDTVVDPRRTVVGPRSQRGAVNLSFALPATLLTSIKNEAQNQARATQSAPSSPRTTVVQMVPADGAGGNGVQSKKASQAKTISLNLGSLVSSAQPSSNQAHNAGRITIGGNVLKLGGSIFPVTFNPTTRSSQTVLATPGVSVAAESVVDKAPKTAPSSGGGGPSEPINHTVQIDIGTPPSSDSPVQSAIETGTAAATSVPVKGSKSSRPMEVT